MTEATSRQIDDFLAALFAVERAWALLDAGDAEGAVREGASAQVLTRAAAMLGPTDPDRAHRLLEQAVTLTAPPAPTQFALSRSFRARGEEEHASLWLRGAMLRTRPDAALLLELAAIETDHADTIVRAALSFPCRDAAIAADAASALVAYGKLKPARIAGTIAFEAGARDGDFLALYSDLLANPDLLDEPPLPEGPLGMPHWWQVAASAAQARLAGAFPPAPLIARAQAREASDRWVASDRLGTVLKGRIDAGEPFSWIRLGDGEGRFLMHRHAELRGALPAREAAAMAKQIWYAWFGQDLDMVAPEALAALGARFEQAIGKADLLGVTSAERLAGDPLHYGFCAGLETYLATLPEHPGRMLCDALAPLALNRRDPFLGSLLRGRDFLGVVGPHPDLAARLQRHLQIEAVASYDLPGEARLARLRDRQDGRVHFPIVHDEIMAALAVPHRGAVFLVAGGLLGKIYCDRIRELDGIALDIGALADAWMGYNTRGTAFDAAAAWPLPA